VHDRARNAVNGGGCEGGVARGAGFPYLSSMAERAVVLVGHGGVPSDVPRDLVLLDAVRPSYPGVRIRYAWPFDMNKVAEMLAAQVRETR
jgi:hypothetical protein